MKRYVISHVLSIRFIKTYIHKMCTRGSLVICWFNNLWPYTTSWFRGHVNNKLNAQTTISAWSFKAMHTAYSKQLLIAVDGFSPNVWNILCLLKMASSSPSKTSIENSLQKPYKHHHSNRFVKESGLINPSTCFLLHGNDKNGQPNEILLMVQISQTTTWDVKKNLVKKRINYQTQHLSAGERRISEPSTVWNHQQWCAVAEHSLAACFPMLRRVGIVRPEHPSP